MRLTEMKLLKATTLYTGSNHLIQVRPGDEQLALCAAAEDGRHQPGRGRVRRRALRHRNRDVIYIIIISTIVLDPGFRILLDLFFTKPLINILPYRLAQAWIQNTRTI